MFPGTLLFQPITNKVLYHRLCFKYCSHLSLFLSFQNLEFHGVVRFYFQDEDHNVVTKCIRVASSATTKEVVDVLVEKFRPDMRMLTANRYNLFEVHINGG